MLDPSAEIQNSMDVRFFSSRGHGAVCVVDLSFLSIFHIILSKLSFSLIDDRMIFRSIGPPQEGENAISRAPILLVSLRPLSSDRPIPLDSHDLRTFHPRGCPIIFGRLEFYRRRRRFD